LVLVVREVQEATVEMPVTLQLVQTPEVRAEVQ
jgi:hypothetical protein